MEVVQFSDDWVVELHTPQCDLDYDGCVKDARYAMRVHECAFRYGCEECAKAMREHVRDSYARFKTLKCGKCNKPFARSDYFEIISL